MLSLKIFNLRILTCRLHRYYHYGINETWFYTPEKKDAIYHGSRYRAAKRRQFLYLKGVLRMKKTLLKKLTVFMVN